jgi:hypothetical protein
MAGIGAAIRSSLSATDRSGRFSFATPSGFRCAHKPALIPPAPENRSTTENADFSTTAKPTTAHQRDPATEAAAAQAAGLTVFGVQAARCRMKFFDIGAVVYILRKSVGWVPDFNVDRYHEQLLSLDRRIRDDGVTSEMHTDPTQTAA